MALCIVMKVKKQHLSKKITISKPMEKHNINYVKPRACDCPTAFFHSKFPSQINQQIYTAPSFTDFKFNDVIYTKANSSLYQLDADGALLIMTGGTYFADFDVDLTALNGVVPGSIIEARLIIESPTGFVPYNTQQLPILFEPITSEQISAQKAWFHANAVIHVGDANYGVSSPSARVYIRLDGYSTGAFQYAPEMHLTIRN